MNIYPLLTISMEASLKQHGLLPQDEFITEFRLHSDDLTVDPLWVDIVCLSGMEYSFDCSRG